MKFFILRHKTSKKTKKVINSLNVILTYRSGFCTLSMTSVCLVAHSSWKRKIKHFILNFTNYVLLFYF